MSTDDTIWDEYTLMPACVLQAATWYSFNNMAQQGLLLSIEQKNKARVKKCNYHLTNGQPNTKRIFNPTSTLLVWHNNVDRHIVNTKET